MGIDYALDAAADVPGGLDDHPLRLTTCDKVVENDVGHVFVENPFVSERLKVLLQALQFDARRTSNVADLDRGEVRLPRLGTKAGEFAYVVLNKIVVRGMGVGKGF